MQTNDTNDAHTPNEKQRKTGDPPTELTERDLSIRMTLLQAGYDISQLKPGAPLPKDAQALLAAKSTRTRVVLRSWPRDPAGQCITPANTQPGKTTSNGVPLWGATLYDFFRVRRIPSLASLSTLTTGSRLAAWMKKHGEEGYAEDEMAWAEREEEPREVPPCDVGSVIEPTDRKLALGVWGRSMLSKDATTDTATDETDEKGELNLNEDIDKEGGRTDKNGDDVGKGKEKPKPFHPSSYPTPWPFVPFSYPVPTLQDYISLNRLPKKLIVHDPWNLLAAKAPAPDSDSDSDLGSGAGETGDWTTTPDITHTYALQLSPEATARLEAEAADAAKEAAESEEQPGDAYAARQGFLIRPTREEPGPIAPPVYVVYPAAPPPAPVEEAHLYISPAHVAGRGNHSVVYTAELEVPRSMLMPPTICRACVLTDVAEILKEMDGEDGSRKEARWREKSARLERVLHVDPAVSLALVPPGAAYETRDGKPVRRKVNADDDMYTFRPLAAHATMAFAGPVRPVETRVPWVSPSAPPGTLCAHTTPRHPRPPTAKVRVTAKLSLQHDPHLAAEARNYQQFPRHLFEHWSGLNLLPPLHDPTPVGAVVPQFYGHYLPVEPEGGAGQAGTDAGADSDADSDSDSGSDDQTHSAPRKRKPYRSPILLLEHCGAPLDPHDLTIDEKNECAALYYRLHHAGWAHGSIAQRNILVQPGPLSAPPFFRLLDAADGGGAGARAFRVIDFGRSKWMAGGGERAGEEGEVARLFGHMGF